MIKPPTLLGDTVDRLTILELKLELISDQTKILSVKQERALISFALDQYLHESGIDRDEVLRIKEQLYITNKNAWAEIDTHIALINICDMVALGNSAYKMFRLNQRRVNLKNLINRLDGDIEEVKSY